MRIEKREIDGQLVEVKVCPPSRRRAHAKIRRVYLARMGNQKTAYWLAKDGGQSECR